MTKTLHELRTTGFNKLRRGRIHLRCDQCGRKQSNAPRGKHDPTSASLVEFPCDKCDAGMKGCDPSYYDSSGNRVQLCQDCCGRDARPNDDYCVQCRAQLDRELIDS